MCVLRQEAAADQLLRDGFQIVAEDHDVVAVPAHAAADVKEDFRKEHQDRADLVRDGFRRMIVAGVERVENPARQRVGEIELVRARRCSSRTPRPNSFAFHRIQVEGRVESPLRTRRPAIPSAAPSGRRDRPACPSSRQGSTGWSRTACRAPCPSRRRFGGTRPRAGSRTTGSPCRDARA